MTTKRDPLSVWVGYKLGSMIAGQRTKREPVAWLYNGVRLLEIPDNPYQYLVLTYDISNKRYEVFASNTALSYENTDAIGGTSLLISAPWKRFRLTDDTWSESSEFTTDKKLTILGYIIPTPVTNVIWSNHDILDSFGAVYLEKSEPVPVYE